MMEVIRPARCRKLLRGYLRATSAAIFFFINIFAGQLLRAQETQKPSSPKPSIQLSEQQRKAVEGVFQDSGNPDRSVQFTARENGLTAKLLWNNAEIQFVAESPLAFVSKEVVEDGYLHIVFIKDSTGIVKQVNLGNIGTWNRNNNYKPVVKIEMKHSPDDLKRFEGLYQLDSEQRFVQFRVKENSLVLKQYWDGNQISFVPETAMDFFSKEIPLFSLSFTAGQDGNITRAIAFRHDLWIKLKKASLTTEELKSYEGKYRSADDPDNMIELSASHNNLIVKQGWDGKEIVLEPLTKTYFYNEAESYPLQVIKDSQGIITQVSVFGIDQFNKVK
jgi:hypothetical protein